ncbi:MAG: PEGA domain-containing protein [Polyangiaceae bacterium]
MLSFGVPSFSASAPSPRSPREPRKTKRAFAASTLIAALVTSSAFLAPTLITPAAQAGDTSAADALFQKGNQAYKAKKWKEAYEAYLGAYEIRKDFKTAANLGDVALTLGKHREAAEYLSDALSKLPPEEASKKGALEARLSQAKKEVGTLKIIVSVEGAQVSCNERDVGKTPIEKEVFVEPGATNVVVKAEGHKEARRTVALARGEMKEVEITLEVDSGAGVVTPPPDSGHHGTGNGKPHTPPPDDGNGAHVSSDGMSTKTIVVIGGAALTAIGLGVGIGFLVDANGADDDAKSQLKDMEAQLGPNGCAANADAAICSDIIDSLEHRDSSRKISTAGFIGAGVFGVGTLAAFLLWPEGDSKTTARVRTPQLSISPTTGGAQASFTAHF